MNIAKQVAYIQCIMWAILCPLQAKTVMIKEPYRQYKHRCMSPTQRWLSEVRYTHKELQNMSFEKLKAILEDKNVSYQTKISALRALHERTLTPEEMWEIEFLAQELLKTRKHHDSILSGIMQLMFFQNMGLNFSKEQIPPIMNELRASEEDKQLILDQFNPLEIKEKMLTFRKKFVSKLLDLCEIHPNKDWNTLIKKIIIDDSTIECTHFRATTYGNKEMDWIIPTEKVVERSATNLLIHLHGPYYLTSLYEYNLRIPLYNELCETLFYWINYWLDKPVFNVPFFYPHASPKILKKIYTKS